MTLLDLTLERFGSVAGLAEELGVARAPLSSALHGHRSCSRWYWQAVGQALGLSSSELAELLDGDTRRTAGGGSRAGSIRCRT
jgi:hypothetical protein